MTDEPSLQSGFMEERYEAVTGTSGRRGRPKSGGFERVSSVRGTASLELPPLPVLVIPPPSTAGTSASSTPPAFLSSVPPRFGTFSASILFALGASFAGRPSMTRDTSERGLERPNPSDIKTGYLWREVLTRKRLTHILENYAQVNGQLPGREASDAEDHAGRRGRRDRPGADQRRRPPHRTRAGSAIEHHQRLQRSLRRYRVGRRGSREATHHRHHSRPDGGGHRLQERPLELGPRERPNSPQSEGGG